MRPPLPVIQPPTRRERNALRIMIVVGLVAISFFLYTMFQRENISYYPLYVLLMITMGYYCLKYLHEWYHYFSMSAAIIPETTKTYTVDVLTTYCAGEPFDMLEDTLRAIRKMHYPHTAWCCDEADDPKVKALCRELGVKHVTRVVKKDAKAGNINNALQYATGELCLILDPDHIPDPAFLDHVVDYFNDESVGFVQVVQAYYNQHESLVAKGAAQQTYQFYGPMMMAMHSYGTVQAIGANCTFRRAALDSIGGHSSGLSEDMHTAMQLHARGWRSMYIPVILTRGLVPATMSSYYKQQLKWSRGTWELLLTVYPKLFRSFTWRQKVHYLTLPFHYLSGIIFFINFLIPVISLFTGYVPLQMDMVNFLLAALPLFMMSVVIRHYVQKWVAEETERGFHIVGGILQIGAWWIHSVGFIYTIIRKKVPYLPTPKNDADALPLPLMLPNLFIALVSLIAISYGVWHDYNPYTIFMVVLAFIQIAFMAFIFWISGYAPKDSLSVRIATKIRGKASLVVIAHGILRRYSIALSIATIVVFVYAYIKQQQLPAFLPKPLPGLQVYYFGLDTDAPYGNAGTPPSALSVTASRKDIAIVSMRVPWGSGEPNVLDTAFLRKIYSAKSIPLLHWQPWQQDSLGLAGRDQNVLQNITLGRYDNVIGSFARQVAEMGKPVFLGYDEDSLQNKQPLFSSADARTENYVAAWRHIHDLFDSAGGNKVIWIWNARDTAAVANEFPGITYVDWLGLNDASTISNQLQTSPLSFNFRYDPYHRLPIFQSGLPVMITGLKGNSVNLKDWWKSTWENMTNRFPEIRSVVIGVDSDAPSVEIAGKRVHVDAVFADAPGGSLPENLLELTAPPSGNLARRHEFPRGIKSIVYDKGYYWFRNRHTLNKRIIEQDVKAMKKMGINTIERTMPGFYDKTVDQVLAANGINLVAKFWLLGTVEVITDSKQMIKQKELVLSAIKDNIQDKNIIAWNVGSDVLYSLANETYQPDYFYYQQKYLLWLSGLCRDIRALDTVRPIVMDLHWDMKGKKRFEAYKAWVPQIDKYMLESDAKYQTALGIPLNEDMTWGKVDVALWTKLPAMKKSGTIPAWQDIENTDFISLNGLLDLEGRKKESFRTVVNTWSSKTIDRSSLPDIKVLKPPQITYESTELTYKLLVKDSTAKFWRVYNGEIPGLRVEWHLVRVDNYGNTMFIKKQGTSASLTISIPREPQFYRLYVEIIKGYEVKTILETLNIPLE